MACPSLRTGNEFVVRSVEYIDCQAQSLGQNGYLALSSPGSVVSTLLTGLLTVFIALYAIRLMLGRPLAISDLVLAAAKIGIVVALATSWPTVQTLLYDTVIFSPEEIASAFGIGGAGPSQSIGPQLQAVDDGVVELTRLGTGRLDITVSGTADGGIAAEAFRGAAVSDNIGFGVGRYIFLAGSLGALAVVRFGAGLLLALTPLFGLLILFEVTRGVFSGWLRALFALALSSLMLAVIINIELNLIIPWLNDALRLRSASYAIASAPIELLVITSVFTFATLILMGLIIRLAFTLHVGQWTSQLAEKARNAFDSGSERQANTFQYGARLQYEEPSSRAEIISERVALFAESGRRRTMQASALTLQSGNDPGPSGSNDEGSGRGGFIPLGQSYRVGKTRHSGLAVRRDARQ